MKLLKITTEKKEGDIFSRIQIGVPKIELTNETGVVTDLSNSVRSCVVDFVANDVVTAKLEMYVGELDIDGVKVVDPNKPMICGSCKLPTSRRESVSGMCPHCFDRWWDEFGKNKSP